MKCYISAKLYISLSRYIFYKFQKFHNNQQSYVSYMKLPAWYSFTLAHESRQVGRIFFSAILFWVIWYGGLFLDSNFLAEVLSSCPFHVPLKSWDGSTSCSISIQRTWFSHSSNVLVDPKTRAREIIEKLINIMKVYLVMRQVFPYFLDVRVPLSLSLHQLPFGVYSFYTILHRDDLQDPFFLITPSSRSQ